MKILQLEQIWTNHQYSWLQYLARLANCTICLGCSGSSCPILRLQRGARWRAHCGSLWGLLGVGFTGLYTTVQWKIIRLNHFAISRNNTFLIKSYEQVTSYLKLTAGFGVPLCVLRNYFEHFPFWLEDANWIPAGSTISSTSVRSQLSQSNASINGEHESVILARLRTRKHRLAFKTLVNWPSLASAIFPKL